MVLVVGLQSVYRQWGVTSSGGANVEIKLPLAYSNTSYSITATRISSYSGDSGGATNVRINSVTTTIFKLNTSASANNAYWNTIGY